MNEKEARTWIKRCKKGNCDCTASKDCGSYAAECYLEGLAQGRSEGKAETIEKAKVLEDCLSDILFITDGKEPIYNTPDTGYNFVAFIKEALAKWEKEK